MNIEIEKRSRAVSLTVLEIDLDRDILIPAYCIANFMSPALGSGGNNGKYMILKGIY